MRERGLPRPSQNQEWYEWANALVDALEGGSGDYETGQIGEFKTLPPGWLPANGSTFSGNSHPALKRVLGGTTLPDLDPVYDPSFKVGIKA